MTKEKKKFLQLKSNDVCQIYELLLRYSGKYFPLTKESRNKIDSIVGSINGRFYDRQIYETNELKITAYLYFLIKDHPFTDGNKRAAVLCFITLCTINKLDLKIEKRELDNLAIYIEKTRDDHQKVIKAISALLF